MSQPSQNLRVMPSRLAKRGPRTLHVIDTAVAPVSDRPTPKKSAVKKTVPAKNATRNIHTLHVIETDTNPSDSSCAIETPVIAMKQVSPIKPAKGGMSIAKKVVDKAKNYLGQKPAVKDSSLRAKAKIPLRSRPVRVAKKLDNASGEGDCSSLLASEKVPNIPQSKKTTESKIPYVPKHRQTKTFVKMYSDKDFRQSNYNYNRRSIRDDPRQYSREPRYHSRSRERSYGEERKQTVPLRRSSRAHPSSIREDLYYEQRYKSQAYRKLRETQLRDFEWEDNDFRDTRQSRQKYKRNSKPCLKESVSVSDNLEDVSDGPLDENDFEEVEVASDDEVEKRNELQIGFTKCKVRYLAFKRGFFKPKWYHMASERTIINCLTVRENDPSKSSSSEKETVDLTKVNVSTENVDSTEVCVSTKSIESAVVYNSVEVVDSTKTKDSTIKPDSVKANALTEKDSAETVPDEQIDLKKSSESVKDIELVETSILNEKTDLVEVSSSNEAKSNHNTDQLEEVEMKDINVLEDSDNKECDDYEVTEDFVEDQLSDSEIIEIEECNIDENSDNSNSPHDIVIEDSDETKTASEPNKEKTQCEDASVSLTDSISSKNNCSSVSTIKEPESTDGPQIEDKNSVNKIILMEVADESKPKSRVYQKSLSKKKEIKDFYQGNTKIQSHLDAWQSHLIGLEYVIEVLDNFTDRNVKKYHCWLCSEDIWCENMVGQTVFGHINSYKHMLDYLAKYFPSCGYKFAESVRSYNSEFILRKCCEEINNKMGYYSMFITNSDYFSNCQTEIKELFDTLTLPENENILDATIHIKELESHTSTVAENVIKSMLDNISPVQVIKTFISTNYRKVKRYSACNDALDLLDKESLAIEGSLEPSRTLIVLTPPCDPPLAPTDPPHCPAPTLGPPVQVFGPPNTPVPVFGPPNAPVLKLDSPNPSVQNLGGGTTTNFVPMKDPQVSNNLFQVPLETPAPKEKKSECKISPKNASEANSHSKESAEKKCDKKLFTKVNAKQANCLKKYMSLASAFGNIKPSKSAKKDKSNVQDVPVEKEEKENKDEGEVSVLGQSKILSFVLEKKAEVKPVVTDDQGSVDLVLEDDGNLVPPGSNERNVSSLNDKKKLSVSIDKEKSPDLEDKNKKSAPLADAEPNTEDDIVVLDEEKKESNVPDEGVSKEGSISVIDKSDSDSVQILDDEDIDQREEEESEQNLNTSASQNDPEEAEAPKSENAKQKSGHAKSSSHSKYCIKRILNKSTRIIRKRKDTSLDLESISESEDVVSTTSKVKVEMHSRDPKFSSTSSKRKRSPSSRSSRSPSLPYNLLRALSGSRSRSKSPLRVPWRRQSRSPIRGGRYINKRSPLRRFSRSPLRRKSRSCSRSPIRRRSRSPIRRQSRSPPGRFSRNLTRRRSRSPVKRRSRSPIKRRSRSPIKRRSRSPIKRRSRSPFKSSRFQHQNRSRSPYKKFRKSSRSPVRRRSKSPPKRSGSPKRYSSTDLRNPNRALSSRYEDVGSSFKHTMSEIHSLPSRSSMHSVHQKPERDRKLELTERSQSSLSNEESAIFAKLQNNQHLTEIMKLPPATRSMVMEILEKYVGDNSKDSDTRISEFMQIVNKTSSAFQQSIEKKTSQGAFPQEGYYQQQLLSSLAGSSNKPNVSYPGIPYPPPSLSRVPQGVPPPFQPQGVPPPQAYPSANVMPPVAPLCYPTLNTTSAPQHAAGQQYQPNVSSTIQQNLIQQPAKPPEVMFKDLKATVSKLFGPKDANNPQRLGGAKWEPILPSKPANIYSPETSAQMHSTSYASGYTKPATTAQQQFSVPPPDTKVSFCDVPSTPNRNLFPVLVKSEASAPSPAAKTASVSSAKISLAQRLAAVLVKYGMTDVSAALLQEMLMKIGAFSSNPPQDINEREIVDILKRLGYLL